MKRILLVAFCCWKSVVFAQVEKHSELYRMILEKDSLLFNVGFNQCDITQFEMLLSNDFEFYHDVDGVSDKQKFLNDLKNGLCGNRNKYQARRVLNPQTSKVFALRKNGDIYAAIQEGEHEFFEKQTGQPEKFGSSARFKHVWRYIEGEWKLEKSFSYEHVTKKATPIIFDAVVDVDAWLKQNKVHTLGLGTIKNGSMDQIRVFGENAQYNTIFNVASLTKPVTALVALKLCEQKKLDLDEPLYKYWVDPDVAKDPKHKLITTRFILSHQTGFKNWRWMNEDEKLKFDFEPGKGYQYSGEGYQYLRKALEKKFNKTLQQLAEELIFIPLQMNDTRYVWDKIDSTRYALNYDDNGKHYPIVKNKIENAADDLLTTIEDYGKFLTALMNGKLISAEMFNEIAKPQTSSEKGKFFGLGFEIYDFGNGEFCLAHGGADVGVRAIVFMLPKSKDGLLIFTNSDSGGNLYEILVKHYLGVYGNKIFDIEMK